MPVKIRLQRRGRKKSPFYHIVIADSRAPRDGRFIEKIGVYNPMTKPATIDLDLDKAFEWLQKGAQPTDTARAILRFKGVMYRKHLQRGVAKGALTQEQADKLLFDWIENKNSKISARVENTAKEKEERLRQIAGKTPPKKAVVQATTETVAASSAKAETVEEKDEEPKSETSDLDAAIEQASAEAKPSAEEKEGSDAGNPPA